MSAINLSPKYILISLFVLFIFTYALSTFDNSNLQKNEFDGICNDIYTEKFWIDTCYLPRTQNKSFYDLMVKVEIAGMALTGIYLLYSKKLHFKN